MGGSCLLQLSSGTGNVEFNTFQNGGTHSQKEGQLARWFCTMSSALTCLTLHNAPAEFPDTRRRSCIEQTSATQRFVPLVGSDPLAQPRVSGIQVACLTWVWEYNVLSMWIKEGLGPLCAAPVPRPSEWRIDHLQGV